MSFLSNSTRVRRPAACASLALAVALSGLGADRAARADDQFPLLPRVEVRSLTTGEDVLLPTALAGRPAVLVLTAGDRPDAAPIGLAAAELQRDYAPWFSWVVVLSGEVPRDAAERLRAGPIFRIERLFHDAGGALRAALAPARLPAIVLVDENGAVRARYSVGDGEGAGALTEFARTFRSLAAASRRPSLGVEDFRLPRADNSGLVSFLDVAGPEGTLVVFLQSRCLPCAREIEVLDFARDRRAGRVTLVAVFLDAAPISRIRGFLAAAGASPDFVLRDPEFKLAGRYEISAAPALLVIDPVGEIVYSRTGYREAQRDALYRDLQLAFDEAARTAGEGSAIAEARRLHEEACAFLREGKPAYALMYQERISELLPDYPSVHLRIAEAALAAGDRELALRSLGRYLAAEPGTYDSAEVRQTLAGLLEAAR